jgi:hypothetical protein
MTMITPLNPCGGRIRNSLVSIVSYETRDSCNQRYGMGTLEY